MESCAGTLNLCRDLKLDPIKFCNNGLQVVIPRISKRYGSSRKLFRDGYPSNPHEPRTSFNPGEVWPHLDPSTRLVQLEASGVGNATRAALWEHFGAYLSESWDMHGTALRFLRRSEELDPKQVPPRLRKNMAYALLRQGGTQRQSSGVFS